MDRSTPKPFEAQVEQFLFPAWKSGDIVMVESLSMPNFARCPRPLARAWALHANRMPNYFAAGYDAW